MSQPRRSSRWLDHLEFTEDDPDLMEMYRLVQEKQLTWKGLQRLPDHVIYWLAAHINQPSQKTESEWRKLSQNAWRARHEVARREERLANARRYRQIVLTAVSTAALAVLIRWIFGPL
jgi:hypothetical protein